MSKQKTSRNQSIVRDFLADRSVYSIAKKHKISWARTKRIIDEHLGKAKREGK
jgi:hypothetical protein